MTSAFDFTDPQNYIAVLVINSDAGQAFLELKTEIASLLALPDLPYIEDPMLWGVEPIQGEFTRTCRVCGCTDTNCTHCILKNGKACHWVSNDLCSGCI